MDEIPTFFVPASTSDNREAVYANFAEWCKCPVPKQEERIYSITFIHNGEEWKATVGERLHGVRRRTSRSQGKKIERKTQLSDSAIVLAIFSGAIFMVVTNHKIGEDVGSAWENPFYAGKPVSVSYFKT